MMMKKLARKWNNSRNHDDDDDENFSLPTRDDFHPIDSQGLSACIVCNVVGV